MSNSSELSSILSTSQLKTAPLEAFLAYDGIQSKYRRMPKDKLSILPKDLPNMSDRVIFNLDNYFAIEKLIQIRNLWHIWLYGKKRKGDTNQLIIRPDGRHLYVMDTDPFFNGKDSLPSLADGALKVAHTNITKYPDFSNRTEQPTAIESNLFKAIANFVNLPPSIKNQRSFKVPSVENLFGYEPKLKMTSPGHGLPDDCIRLGSHEENLVVNVKNFFSRMTESAAALGSVSLAVFSDILLTKDDEANLFRITYSNFHFSFVDYFDFTENDDESDTQKLGAWDQKGFNEWISIRGYTSDSFAMETPNFITNSKLKEFKDRIKAPYNTVLKSGLYELNDLDSELLACQDFKIYAKPRHFKNAPPVTKNFALKEVKEFVSHWKKW